MGPDSVRHRFAHYCTSLSTVHNVHTTSRTSHNMTRHSTCLHAVIHTRIARIPVIISTRGRRTRRRREYSKSKAGRTTETFCGSALSRRPHTVPPLDIACNKVQSQQAENQRKKERTLYPHPHSVSFFRPPISVVAFHHCVTKAGGLRGVAAPSIRVGAC